MFFEASVEIGAECADMEMLAAIKNIESITENTTSPGKPGFSAKLLSDQRHIISREVFLKI